MINKETKDKILTWLLTPLSWLYGTATSLRNLAYDKHLMARHELDVPIISVGNLAVGGTGKTPHVEFLISNLALDYHIGVLSRGYKRHTRGYVLANSSSTAETIGDEPFQIYRKFGMMSKVAVCENRTEGMKRLLQDHPEINLIILDDAFQRRELQPKVSILLTDCHRPYYEDNVLPLGRLRESKHGAERADIIVVTKCPADMQPIDYRQIAQKIDKLSFQKLFFTRYHYGELKPVFPEDCPYQASMSRLTDRDAVLLLTGIANPRFFIRQFKQYPVRKKVFHFQDHHAFSRSDLLRIEKMYEDMEGERKLIVTTEKDAARLLSNPYFPEQLKKFIFFQPIEVKVLDGLDGPELIETVKAIIEKKNPLD